MFNGIFSNTVDIGIEVWSFILCIFVSLLLGCTVALTYRIRTRHTPSFLITIAILPAIVCVVIMMVNGNIGAGVAVAGAFSLVRFRSAPGTAREICMIFIAMGIGLMCGMGYLGFAALFTVIIMAVYLAYVLINSFACNNDNNRILTITIPEDLSYDGLFEDIFNCYTTRHELTKVKTTNMGSLFKLTYTVTLKNVSLIKEMIDSLRIRNGNLEITLAHAQDAEEL